ncbi:MAG TPA: ECF-type sigma factor [Vicinamibacterales bacterium]|nr:ECF-type sigma factor [Vicinamibacterales bacterium]
MDGTDQPTIALLFAASERGDPSSNSALFAALYSELHRIATRELSRQGWGVSIGATSLLHEAYMDLSRRDGTAFPDRSRFMAYAARVMRGLIVDYARNRRAQKRGGLFELTALSTDTLEVAQPADELVRIGEAVDDLFSVEPMLAEVVDLKYFCGFSFEEIAAMKGISERTVRRQWIKARVYLHSTMSDVDPAP